MVADTQAIPLKTCSLEPVWFVWVELWERDDARVREAVADAIGLDYGSYDRVAFESAFGNCFFRPREGAKSGQRERTSEIPVRVLTFSLPRNAEMLGQAIEAIRYAHTLEEPVIYVTEALAQANKPSHGADGLLTKASEKPTLTSSPLGSLAIRENSKGS